MTTQEKVFETLQETGLNWTVSKDALYTASGVPTNSYGIIRKDTQEWLGTVGKVYEPYQNFQLAETIVKASEGLSDNITGGFFADGKKVFLQVNLDDVEIATDTVKRNITALNSHDGSSSIGFGSSNTVVVCRNTFYMAMKDLRKFWHTASAEQLIDIAREQLRESIENDTMIMESYKRMVDHKIDKPIFSRVINRLFNVDMDDDQSKIHPIKKNKMTKFNIVLESELDSHGETVWGLFNAVTYYTNHVLPKNKDKDEFVTLGAGYDKNLATYDEIMSWMNSKQGATVLV